MHITMTTNGTNGAHFKKDRLSVIPAQPDDTRTYETRPAIWLSENGPEGRPMIGRRFLVRIVAATTGDTHIPDVAMA